jgi:hypothetical protein
MLSDCLNCLLVDNDGLTAIGVEFMRPRAHSARAGCQRWNAQIL